MKLISLELKNYTRLYVSGIKHIIYTPETSFNIILGRNGSGKSSLVKEMFPNVDELKNDYGKGGYKILRLEHNSNKYVISYNRDNNKHSFIVNDEELNKQYIQKTQKILIEQHFKLNKHIYEMLLSTNNFTSMSVSERKRWFTDILTTVDYDYALNLYNKTKVRLKELTSFMKLVQAKLMKNSDLMKELTPEYIKGLETEKEMLYKLVDHMLSMKSNEQQMQPVNINLLEQKVNELEHYMSKIEQGKNKEFYNREIFSLLKQRDDIRERSKKIQQQLSKIDELKIDKGVSLKDLEEEKNSLLSKIKELLVRYDVNDIDELILETSSYRNSYNSLLMKAESIQPLVSYHSTDVSKLRDLLKHKEGKLSLLSEQFIKLDKEFMLLSSFKEQPDVTCPSCSNIFKPNFDNGKYIKLKEEISKIYKEKEKITEEYETIKFQLEQTLDLNNTLDSLTDELDSCCKHMKKRLEPLITEHIVSIFSSTLAVLPDYNELLSLRDKLAELDSKINVYKKLSSEKLDFIANRKKELIDEHISNIHKIESINNTIDSYKLKLKQLDTIISLQTDISSLIRRQHKYKLNVREVEFNRYINNVVLELKRDITDIETKLLEFDRLKSNSEELELELKEYEIKLKSVKELEKLLSPTKGLIGESINTTMNSILNRMNEIINKVWSYEIDILPCDINESDLTFRFPVNINSAKIIPDISKGSSSIKDIIDLAFKITAMEFLELLDYPLILDELGSTFSVSHRVSVYDFVDELSKGYFNQVFMISHFDDMFGRFKNTDVIVLDNDGINFTGTHNKIIEIKR